MAPDRDLPGRLAANGLDASPRVAGTRVREPCLGFWWGSLRSTHATYPPQGVQGPDERIELLGIPEIGEIKPNGRGVVRRVGDTVDQVLDTSKKRRVSCRRLGPGSQGRYGHGGFLQRGSHGLGAAPAAIGIL